MNLYWKIVTQMMFHDWEEFFTGDVLFDLKYNDLNGEKMRYHFDQFVEYKKRVIFNRQEKIDNFINIHVNTKMGFDFARHLCKMCDWLACLKYIYQEIDRGNKQMFSLSRKALKLYNQETKLFISAVERNDSAITLIDLNQVKIHLVP